MSCFLDEQDSVEESYWRRTALIIIFDNMPETTDERISGRNYLEYMEAAAVVAGVAAVAAYGLSEYYGKQTPSLSPTTPTPISGSTERNNRIWFG